MSELQTSTPLPAYARRATAVILGLLYTSLIGGCVGLGCWWLALPLMDSVSTFHQLALVMGLTAYLATIASVIWQSTFHGARQPRVRWQDALGAGLAAGLASGIVSSTVLALDTAHRTSDELHPLHLRPDVFIQFSLAVILAVGVAVGLILVVLVERRRGRVP